jgi:hypothetical protein
MESLNNYITERIRIDNVKPMEFPVNGNQYDVVDFLEKNGFVEIKGVPNIPWYTGYIDFFNKKKNRCFGIKLKDSKDSSSNQFICFTDTSKDKISKSNMLYVINFDPKTLNPIRYRKIWRNSNYGVEMMDEDEFEKEMKSYFG